MSDKIITHPATAEYREGHDRIFGKTRYLAYPGDARVFASSQPSDDPDLIVKDSTGRALRPLDVTPSPVAVAVHAALDVMRK